MTTTSKALKQKMAQSVSGMGPSLVPASKPPLPPVKQDEVIPKIDELIGDADDLATLTDLISLHVTLNKQKKAAEDKLEPVKDRIKAIVGQYGIDKMQVGFATVNYFRTERRSINATKLVALGVDQEVIDAATDTSVSATLKIVSAK